MKKKKKRIKWFMYFDCWLPLWIYIFFCLQFHFYCREQFIYEYVHAATKIHFLHLGIMHNYNQMVGRKQPLSPVFLLLKCALFPRTYLKIKFIYVLWKSDEPNYEILRWNHDGEKSQNDVKSWKENLEEEKKRGSFYVQISIILERKK